MKHTLLTEGQLVKVNVNDKKYVCVVREVEDYDPYKGRDYEFRAFGGLPFHPEEVEDILPIPALPSICFSK